MPVTSFVGLQKSPSSTTSSRAPGAKAGGRLAGVSAACTMTSAIRSMTARLAVGRIRPGMPTRSPPRTSSSPNANVSTSARSSLVSHTSGEANTMEGERSGQIQIVCAASHSRSRT